METKRINLIVKEDVLQYFDGVAKDYGVSRGAMFAFLVANWRKQEENVQAVKSAHELMDYLKSEDEGKA